MQAITYAYAGPVKQNIALTQLTDTYKLACTPKLGGLGTSPLGKFFFEFVQWDGFWGYFGAQN